MRWPGENLMNFRDESDIAMFSRGKLLTKFTSFCASNGTEIKRQPPTTADEVLGYR